MDIFTTVLIMILCLLLEGFFSGSEIGVVSADQPLTPGPSTPLAGGTTGRYMLPSLAPALL